MRRVTKEKLAKEYAKRVEECASHDVEMAHLEADAVLVALLNELGFQEVTAAWGKIRKWYA
jgi:hypothetical protein